MRKWIVVVGMLIPTIAAAQGPPAQNPSISILLPVEDDDVSTGHPSQYVLKVDLVNPGEDGTVFKCTGELDGLDHAEVWLFFKWRSSEVPGNADRRTALWLGGLAFFPGDFTRFVAFLPGQGADPWWYLPWDRFTFNGRFELDSIGSGYPVTMRWTCDCPDLMGLEAVVSFSAN